MHLEQLRVPFDYRIEIDSTIQPDNEEIPGMLLQPIVENAVKHGISSVRDGVISIHFSKDERLLLAEITDNGAGFPSVAKTDSPDKPDSLGKPLKGFGLKATEKRLRLINEEFKTNIGIRFENNDPSGAKVVISIPV